MLDKIKNKWAKASPKLKIVAGVIAAIIIISIIF
mgnify:CR=1 FL=1